MRLSTQIQAFQESIQTLHQDIAVTPAEVNADWLRERLIDTVEMLAFLTKHVHDLAVECEAAKEAAFQAGNTANCLANSMTPE